MNEEPFLVRFARHWGWRAYAIPVLIVLTIFVVVDAVRSSGDDTQDAINRGISEQDKRGPIPSSKFAEDKDSGELPPGAPITEESSGKYIEFSQPAPVVGENTDNALRYAVEVESTIKPGVFGGGDAFAATVNATLSDQRSWIADSAYAFEAVRKDDDPDLLVQLVSTQTAHEICGHDLEMETSCFLSSQSSGEPGRVLINEARWVRGARPFQGDLGLYRQYVINHEIGHALGYGMHEPCAVDGGIAPIMMQQTLSVSNDELHSIDPDEAYSADGKVCSPNGWPYPHGQEDKAAAPTQEKG